MFKGFNLNVPENHFENWVARGNSSHDENKSNVQAGFADFFDNDGILSATKIGNNWFPKVHADIFISHSRKDSQIAVGLAGWLEAEFGLTSFIDSTVWGYSDNLLKKFDNIYCRDGDTGPYDYDTRNKTTTHVNIMLASALNNMIDRTECVFFLNTPSSLSCQGYTEKNATVSPWIFSEITMTRLIERKINRITTHKRKAEASMEVLAEDIKIKYDLSLNHLISLDSSMLDRWERSNHKRGSDSLDSLYQITA